MEQGQDFDIHQRVERQYTAVTAELCRRSLRRFVKAVWPIMDPHPYVESWFLDCLCDHLAYVTLGDIRQLMVCLPPRLGKSSVCSAAFPAWVWTDEPELQFLTASYAIDVALGDAGKHRRIVESAWYRARYPEVILWSDQNRADDFRNTLGGYRQSISIGGVTTAKGGDIQILDDPHNTAKVESQAMRKAAITWHDGAWRSRVNDQNKARRVYVAQRSHAKDLFGHILEKESKRWVVVNLPMEYEHQRKCITFRNKGSGAFGDPIFKDPRTVEGSLLSPDRFGPEAVEAEKEALPTRVWNAQYQQRPEGADGVIWKRKWWRKWEWPEWHEQRGKSERPLPEVLEIIQAYDTNFEQGEEDSYMVRTTWGVFEHQETIRGPKGATRQTDPKINTIILERKKWRPTFGAMVDDAMESFKEFAPERVLVEKKASGHSLIQELRKKGIPVRGVKVLGDLVYRAHMSGLPLEKGAIWYPPRNWANDLIETCSAFPQVDYDDEVSSCAIAFQYLRKYMDLTFEDDEETEDLDLFNPRILKLKRGYYG